MSLFLRVVLALFGVALLVYGVPVIALARLLPLPWQRRLRDACRNVDRALAPPRRGPPPAAVLEAFVTTELVHGYAERIHLMAGDSAELFARFGPLVLWIGGDPSQLAAAVRSYFAGGPMPEHIADGLRDLYDV